MTEMASLSALLGENRQRLRSMLALIETRLDSFAPRPTPLQGESANTPPEPLPGTLACLRSMGETTGRELKRMDELCMRLRDLL